MQRLENLFKHPGRRVLPTSTTRYLPALIIISGLIGLIPQIFSNAYIHTLGSLIMIYGVLAISIDILAGYIGLLALGQSAFFGFGAYTCGYLLTACKWPHEWAILVALIASGILALLFGLITLKTWGNTFFMITIALVQVIWGLAFKLTPITGGDNGMGGIRRPTFFGIKFANSINFYYLLFAVFILVIFLAYRFVNSPFGLTMHGLRENRRRMRALGYNIYAHKLTAYVFAGLLAGLSGIMYALFNRFVSPSDITTMASSTAFLMALLGGCGTLVGPIIGSIIITLLKNYISSYTARWTMVMGGLYVLVVMLSPGGVVGAYHTICAAISRKRKGKVSGKIPIEERKDTP